MKYNQPIGGAVNDPYVDANPSTGVEGSPVPAAAIEAPQREIVNVIAGAGLTPDLNDNTQLSQAIQRLIAGGGYKASVRAATTANIGLTGEQTIDGVAVVAGNRVLAKDQTTGAENGIYIVAAGAWARAEDANNAGELTSGALVPVEQGTANTGTLWMLTTDGTITIGTTALTFVSKDAKTAQVAAVKKLYARTNSVNPAYQYNITADEAVLKDANGNSVLVSNIAVTGDITVAGANGLDTGAEAANMWYIAYLIYSQATGAVASLLSTGNNPTMPAGYTHKCVVSIIRNDSGSNFLGFRQRDEMYQYTSPPTVLSGGTATAVTAVDIGTVVPGNAKSVLLELKKTSLAAIGESSGYVSAGSAGESTAKLSVLAYSGGSVQGGKSNGELQVDWPDVQPNIYYRNSNGSLTVVANGFRLRT